MKDSSSEYEFDVFVSYRRYGEWPLWIQEHFRPVFEHYLGEDLGRNARVFFDNSLESGDEWPNHLGRALGRSAVLVPLWSKTYFNSPWCITECAFMFKREEICGYRATRDDVLVLPASIHDGDEFPDYARRVQYVKLNEYANVRLNKTGHTAEAMVDRIKAWTPTVATAVKRAPADCDPAWVDLSVREMAGLIEVMSPRQDSVPTLGGSK
jgi:TIR domain